MKSRFAVALLMTFPMAAQANPVSVDEQSLLAFAMVAFWALVIESGMVTLSLASTGAVIVPLFGTLIISNVVVFVFAFLPLTGRISLWFLEPVVVVGHAVLIKVVGLLPFVQGAAFIGVR